MGDESSSGKVGTHFLQLFTFLFLVSSSQLQKHKSVPRNDCVFRNDQRGREETHLN